MPVTYKKLFSEAEKYIPGGVNSPVRSFGAVGGYPVFVKEGAGARITGELGEDYIDYCLSWGALILGHARPEVVKALRGAVKKGTSFGTATKPETRLAKLIAGAVPSVDKVRLTNSGTEAVMGAVRLARAFTGRNKIIKFKGAYHGHADYLLTAGGSGQATAGKPDSPGVPGEFSRHTVSVNYNDAEGAAEAAGRHKDDLAAIIVEPVAANCGVIPPQPGFLQELRRIADKSGAVLIFDEVITGFRLAPGGAQEYFGVLPDMTCLGKIIGGGLPVGAFGGRSDIMKLLAPAGNVYQAGTLSGNPVAVTAGITTLELLEAINPYEDLREKTEGLSRRMEREAGKRGIKIRVNRAASMFSVFFTGKNVADYDGARGQDLRMFSRFHARLLEEGVYFSPSGFEANFLSSAHTERVLAGTCRAIGAVFDNLNN